MRRYNIRGWTVRIAAALAISGAISACSTTRTPHSVPRPPASAITPPATAQYGVASWYGPGFDGHRTSNGEIYNQEDLTAASTIYPLGSRVMVTNLNNGRAVEVRINDHGPFKKGRKIDLSHKAATVIGMIGPGTAPVKIDLLSVPRNSRPVGAAPRYFVQVGSFANAGNATHLENQLASRFSDVRIDPVEAGTARYYRVRMGAYATRAEAAARAGETARIGLPVVIVSE